MAGVIDLVEAAQRLRVSWHTAYRLVLQGQLRGWRRGGRWYVDVQDVRRLARRRQRAGAS